MWHWLIEEVPMIRVPTSMHRITFVLLLIVLPLTALVCNWIPLGSPGNATATATASPTPVLSIATSAFSGFNLWVSWEGNYSPPNGLLTATYGPDTVTIPLESSGNTYVGTYEGVWHASVTGTCTATGNPPVAFKVTAQKDEFGHLDFSVERSIVWSWDTVCPGVSGGSTSSKQTYTYTFILPTEDGASKTFSPGGPTWTFVLKTPVP
jgi:hypothetical protein